MAHTVIHIYMYVFIWIAIQLLLIPAIDMHGAALGSCFSDSSMPSY